MFRFKSCPRCTGDMFIERMDFGWDEVCLNCGFRRDHRVFSVAEKVRVLKSGEERRELVPV